MWNAAAQLGVGALDQFEGLITDVVHAQAEFQAATEAATEHAQSNDIHDYDDHVRQQEQRDTAAVEASTAEHSAETACMALGHLLLVRLLESPGSLTPRQRVVDIVHRLTSDRTSPRKLLQDALHTLQTGHPSLSQPLLQRFHVIWPCPSGAGTCAGTISSCVFCPRGSPPPSDGALVVEGGSSCRGHTTLSACFTDVVVGSPAAHSATPPAAQQALRSMSTAVGMLEYDGVPVDFSSAPPCPCGAPRGAAPGYYIGRFSTDQVELLLSHFDESASPPAALVVTAAAAADTAVVGVELREREEGLLQHKQPGPPAITYDLVGALFSNHGHDDIATLSWAHVRLGPDASGGLQWGAPDAAAPEYSGWLRVSDSLMTRAAFSDVAADAAVPGRLVAAVYALDPRGPHERTAPVAAVGEDGAPQEQQQQQQPPPQPPQQQPPPQPPQQQPPQPRVRLRLFLRDPQSQPQPQSQSQSQLQQSPAMAAATVGQPTDGTETPRPNVSVAGAGRIRRTPANSSVPGSAALHSPDSQPPGPVSFSTMSRA